MPLHNINEITKLNEQSKKAITATHPVGVFVGGTSGIGEHTAYAFARYTTAPTVYIVGRNIAAGEAIMAKLKELNTHPDAKFYFYAKDMSLIGETDKLVQTIKEKESKINLLFLSTGYLTFEGRQETSEGLETKISLNYYSRWRVATQLLPLLTKAAAQGENARVVSVLGAGTEGLPEMDDLDLEKKYSISRLFRNVSEFNSLAVTRFSKIYPDIAFVHAFPGLVKTGIGRVLPWYMRALMYVAGPLSYSAEESAEKFYYVGYGGPEFAKGGHLINEKLEDISEKPTTSGFLTAQLQEDIWKHTEDIYKKALQG